MDTLGTFINQPVAGQPHIRELVWRKRQTTHDDALSLTADKPPFEY